MTRVQRAIEYAKSKIIELHPELCHPEIRKGLSRTDKLIIINLMLELADEDYYRVDKVEAI